MKTTKILITIQLAVFFNCFSQSGLIASYPFNGNANDISGNANNGIVNGAILTNDRFGNPNSAYLFNGINSFINLGNNFAYNSHSFLCFARRDSTLGNTLVSKINNGPHNTKNSELDINQFIVGSGTTWNTLVSTFLTVDFTQWNCYASTFNSLNNRAKFYINGIVDSATFTGYSDVINTPIYIGARPFWSGAGGTSFYFKGAIDDVSIYNRALTKQEIDSICQSLVNGIPQNEIFGIKASIDPSTKLLVINSNTNFVNALLTIYNSLGEQVFKTDGINGQEIKLQLNLLKKGVYFIHLSQDNHLITSKKIILDN